MRNHYYTAYVRNDQGASDKVRGEFSSIEAAAAAIRFEYGPGWTAHILRVEGDNADEVKTFTIRAGSAAAGQMGAVRTDRKANASRANGAKGGRPKGK